MIIKLENDLLSIGISPNLGASVLFFRYKGKDIFQPASEKISSAHQTALFAMLPYCGHITEGKFTYFGITRQIISNTKDCSCIDGDGWQHSWKAEQISQESATLLYEHDKSAGGFPFNYLARITYTLKGNQLHISLSIKNPGKLPLPCGMGIHPVFTRKSEAKLYFKSSHIWYHENTPIFDRPYETPKEWNFQNGKSVTEKFDTCFGGWDGQATIEYPDDLKIQITAPDIFHHLFLSTKTTDADCFCLAPASNTPDAFNLASQGVINTGIQSVGPEQILTKDLIISVESNK